MTYLLSLSLLGLLCSSLNPQQDMVCTTTRPRDMRNVDVYYVHKNGHLTEKYCIEKATSSSHLTANVAPTFRSTATLQSRNPACKDDVLPVLPGYGYNILTGMPLSDGKDAMDPGYLNAPVFDPSYAKCSTTGNHVGTGYTTWGIPDTYSVTLLNSMTKGSQMSSIHDEHTFQKEAKSSLTVSGGYEGYGADVSFTAGARWASSTQKFEEGETVEQRFTREAWAFQSTLVPAEVPLSTGYLQTLCSAYLSNDWTVFFMNYGTHVTTDVTCGARYSQVTTFTRKKFEEITSNEAAYNLGIKASYMGATGSVDVTTENAKKERDMVESAASDQYMVSTGGNGAALDGTDTMVEYQRAAHNFPAPLSSSLLAHDVLIIQTKWDQFQDAMTLYHANDPNAKDVTPEKFTQKWVAALEAYCADDAHKCKAATSNGAPTPMTLTPIHFESDVYGKSGNWQGKRVVYFDTNVLHMKPLVKISKIRTYCGLVSNGRKRLRGIQFEYFDGTRSASSDILGMQGNSDSDSGGVSWDDQETVVQYGEFISAVEVSAGDNIDGIWFHVQKLKDSTTRKIGCGYSTDNQKVFNIDGDQKLLAFQGTSINMDGYTVVTQIQFRTYLTMFPNFKETGAVECNCALPNNAQTGTNGAYCSDSQFLWCGDSQACSTSEGVSFPKSSFLNQCKPLCLPGPIVNDYFGVAPCVCEGKLRSDGVCRGAGTSWKPYVPGCGCSGSDLMCMRRCDDYEATLPRATLQSAASPTPTHEELLQMIETKKAARNEEAGAEPHNPPARSYKSARNEEPGAEPHNNPPARSYKSARNEEPGAEPHNPPARFYKSARNEEAGAEPHNNPPARSYRSARNEEAGAEPHNNPPARSYKSARNEEAGAEPHNNPPARSYRSARNEEAGAEPHNNPPARSYKSARNEEAGAEPHNNPPARSYRSARNDEPGAEPKPRMFKSTGTAPRATKDSTHHHSKWEETKESVRHTVKDMSKELKDTIRAELKELVAKELKSALGNLQHKQIQLESTMTRMLLHQVESY